MFTAFYIHTIYIHCDVLETECGVRQGAYYTILCVCVCVCLGVGCKVECTIQGETATRTAPHNAYDSTEACTSIINQFAFTKQNLICGANLKKKYMEKISVYDTIILWFFFCILWYFFDLSNLRFDDFLNVLNRSQLRLTRYGIWHLLSASHNFLIEYFLAFAHDDRTIA